MPRLQAGAHSTVGSRDRPVYCLGAKETARVVREVGEQAVLAAGEIAEEARSFGPGHARHPGQQRGLPDDPGGDRADSGWRVGAHL